MAPFLPTCQNRLSSVCVCVSEWAGVYVCAILLFIDSCEALVVTMNCGMSGIP